MTIKYPIPAITDLSKLISALVGTEIQVKPSSPWDMAISNYNIAIYYTDTNSVAAICLTDSVAAACLGGMLIQSDNTIINEAIQSNNLTTDMLDGLKEVMNNITSLLHNDDSPHLIYKDLKTAPPTPTDEIKNILENPVSRLDIELTIPGYPDSRLSILTTTYDERSELDSDSEWIEILIEKI